MSWHTSSSAAHLLQRGLLPHERAPAQAPHAPRAHEAQHVVQAVEAPPDVRAKLRQRADLGRGHLQKMVLQSAAAQPHDQGFLRVAAFAA